MFIQSQHSGTSSSGVVLQHNHKKRKLDHLQQDYSSEGNSVYSLNGGNLNLSQSVVQGSNRNNVQHKSPNGVMPQNFIRASTIKLLDTYQRCGQKVSNNNY